VINLYTKLQNKIKKSLVTKIVTIMSKKL